MMYELTEQIRREVTKVIVGKDAVADRVLTAILAKGHVLLDDVPGVGKTTMALAFARTLGLETRRVQFTPDTLPSDILGFSVYDKQSGRLDYKAGAVMTNLLLADEINRTSSRTQAALLEAMEERRVTVDGVTHPLPVPFAVLATQNPVGSAGTQRLPASQLDRFLVRLHMGYPDRAAELAIMKERHHADPLDAVQPVTDIATLRRLIDEVSEVHIADAVYDYVARLAEATRSHPYVELGVSPRGALAVCRCAKAYAYLARRDYVVPEDVAAVLPDVCAHRLVMNAKARLHEYTPESALSELLREIAPPTVREFAP